MRPNYPDLALVAHDKVLSATFNLTGHPDYEVPTGGTSFLRLQSRNLSNLLGSRGHPAGDKGY